METQELIVYGLFVGAVVYFGVRFYLANIKKKAAKDGKACNDGHCGCD